MDELDKWLATAEAVNQGLQASVSNAVRSNTSQASVSNSGRSTDHPFDQFSPLQSSVVMDPWQDAGLTVFEVRQECASARQSTIGEVKMNTLKDILIALDGSKNSQIAADYGFWIASKLNANLAAQHVVDPRLVELFVEPEFAEELGMMASIETSDKVFAAIRKIGKLVLDRFAAEAHRRGFDVVCKLSEGRIVEEILKYAQKFDLLIVGHRGSNETQTATNVVLGSVAERLVVSANGPVLIAVQPLDQIDRVIVAFDGSDAAIGALLMAENLAKYIGAKLQAVVVTTNSDGDSKAKLLVEQGELFLREYWTEDVFSVKSGSVSGHLLEAAGTENSLLVLGAYGFKDPNETVLGSTTVRVIRETKRSVLIYKPKFEKVKPAKGSRSAVKSH